MKIKRAESIDEINEIRSLFREYVGYLGIDLCFQSFEEELAALPGKYSPPTGELLIGLMENSIAGCVALRKLEEGICEMKRLYVRPVARGTGLGRQLASAIIAAAKDRGYTLMRLDTLTRLKEAMKLYESLGFQKVAPYYYNPLPDVVYWELELKDQVNKGIEVPG